MREVLSSGIRLMQKYINKVFVILFLLLAGGSLLDCSGKYARDRGRDFADIWTVEFSEGTYGAAVRAGPLKVGALYKDPSKPTYGLRGGYWGKYYTGGYTALFFGSDYFGTEPLEFGESGSDTKKEAEKEAENVPIADPLAAMGGGDDENNGDDDPFSNDERILKERNKLYYVRNPFGTTKPLTKAGRIFKRNAYDMSLKKEDEWAPAYYFTQFEITVGVYYGVTLGVNFGELLDFILGIFTIDIMRDDDVDDPLIRALRKHPLWDQLSDEEQDKMIQAVRSGMITIPEEK